MKTAKGLNSSNQNLLVGLLFFVLLMWAPVEPYGMVIRIAYLVALPALLWFGLRYFGSKWDGDAEANNRLTRGIAGIIAGAFFVGAYLSFTAPYHTECTQSVQTRDGTECVGDYVSVKGRDMSGMFIQLVFGGLAARYAVSKHNETS